MKRIGIAGAGLVGSLMAHFLAKRGYEVVLFDKRPHPEDQPLNGRRSINLALSTRGLRALEAVGMKERIVSHCMTMYGRGIHTPEGDYQFQPYGVGNQHIFAVSRRALNLDLISHLPKGVRSYFESSFVSWKSGTLQIDQAGKTLDLELDYLIGADGAFSKVRSSILGAEPTIDELSHQYQEFLFPPMDGDWALEKDKLHIWPRRQFMLIALPNPDGSFTGTLFLAGQGEVSFSGLSEPVAFRAFFEQHFPDALALLPDFDEQCKRNPISSLMTIRVPKWVHGNTLLVGDAAHAIVPFYGQGMNAGFEDCFLLDQWLDKGLTLPEASLHFAEQRKKDADAIAQMALENFVEMRDKVIDENFLLQKEIEAYLHFKYPELWVPKYSRVTFTNEPYADALAHAERQRLFVQGLISKSEFKENWKSPEHIEKVEALIAGLLSDEGLR